jgi:hypothetical protein
MALKNGLQFQAAGAAPLYGSSSVRFGIEHRVARALAVPFDGFNLQHRLPIISLSGQNLPLEKVGDTSQPVAMPAQAEAF